MTDLNLELNNPQEKIGSKIKKQEKFSSKSSKKRLIIILVVGLLLVFIAATAYWFLGDKIASFLIIKTEEGTPTPIPTLQEKDPEITIIENESKDLEDSLSDLDSPDLELEMPVLDFSTDY